MLKASIFLFLGTLICGCQTIKPNVEEIFYRSLEKETKNLTLCKMDINGGGKTEVLRLPKETCDKYAWDGEKILISILDYKEKLCEIWLMDINKNMTKITEGFIDTDHVLSPNGKKIVFSRSKDLYNPADLYLMDRNGINLKQLTNTPLEEQSPCFSPDGKKIVFQAEPYRIWIPGTFTTIYYQEPENEDDYDSELYIMDVDGKNRIQLTHNLVEDCQPVWSPDGKWIAFTKRESVGRAGLYIVSPDGNREIRIVKWQVFASCWTSDSKKIIFVMVDNNPRDPKTGDNLDIFTVDINRSLKNLINTFSNSIVTRKEEDLSGRNLKNLTNTPDIDENWPCWVSYQDQ